MYEVSLEDAKKQLPDLIDAAVEGKEIIIAKDPQHIVKLVPVPTKKPRPRFGSAKGLITMSDDFDEPLKDFDEYLK